MSKKDYKNVAIIISLFLVYVFFVYLSGHIYGSTIDFESQHFAIPEYFRTLFYQTKNIFPNFAPHLGGGQNIYYLSYYGLYNPYILLSYLFPFIKMVDYIQIINILIVISSIFLFYKFIIKKTTSNLAFLTTFMFAFSLGFTFHSHRHIMFMNYMPFLLLGFISIDNYLKDTKKVNLLIISILMIILCSYYFSVGGLICLFVYATSYILFDKKESFKNKINRIIKLTFVFIIPILISMVLLLPTLYSLLAGRLKVNNSVNLLKLLIPNFTFNSFLYKGYSLGLSSISLICLLLNFNTNNKRNKFLSICIMLITIFPIFTYILNGTMYVDYKALIPFLPLVLYLIPDSLDQILSNKYSLKIYIIIILIINILLFIFNKLYFYIFIFDSVALLVGLLLKNKKMFIILMCSSIYGIFTIVNSMDTFITTDQYKYQNAEYNYELASEIKKLNKDDLYRTSNETSILSNVNRIFNSSYYKTTIYSSTSSDDYTKLIRNDFNNEIFNKDMHTITQSSNIIFNSYMGTKYIISEDKKQLGYELYKEMGNNKLYINNNALPIGYVNPKLMSLREYKTLKYPYNVDALYNYIIIDKNINDVYESNIDVYEDDNINNNYNFEIKPDSFKHKISLTKEIKNKVLFIKFNMNYSESCKNLESTNITINGQKNSLSCKTWKYNNNNNTFEYVLSLEEGINELDLEFTKGKYEITNVSLYTMDYNKFTSVKQNISDFKINTNKTKGDIIEGNINVKNKGYYMLSIPHDKGFSIYVNDKKQKYEKVDLSFIGFELNKGEYNIKIKYSAPYFKEGMCLSIIGIIVFIVYNVIIRSSKKDERND